ncbi:hypothetical protein QT381_15000 [Galbitalea sp. SE-J8]|uniref:hypothetical protein n=1 Tax=Galbitalea sp. SE-J8 TaxID=3054952 RepID=UPI00259CAE7F|nr:hypothetical protein [Galbitalea sp. SE-J8]MDM4764312.1 hypothetical protein [Galbitalea sp. SE-J8]
MTDEHTPAAELGEDGTEAGTEELLSQLGLIEDQPLDARAPAYAQLHDQLSAALDGGESRR